MDNLLKEMAIDDFYEEDNDIIENIFNEELNLLVEALELKKSDFNVLKENKGLKGLWTNIKVRSLIMNIRNLQLKLIVLEDDFNKQLNSSNPYKVSICLDLLTKMIATSKLGEGYEEKFIANYRDESFKDSFNKVPPVYKQKTVIMGDNVEVEYDTKVILSTCKSRYFKKTTKRYSDTANKVINLLEKDGNITPDAADVFRRRISKALKK